EPASALAYFTQILDLTAELPVLIRADEILQVRTAAVHDRLAATGPRTRAGWTGDARCRDCDARVGPNIQRVDDLGEDVEVDGPIGLEVEHRRRVVDDQHEVDPRMALRLVDLHERATVGVLAALAVDRRGVAGNDDAERNEREAMHAPSISEEDPLHPR